MSLINCKYCNAFTVPYLKCRYCGKINETDKIKVLQSRLIDLLKDSNKESCSNCGYFNCACNEKKPMLLLPPPINSTPTPAQPQQKASTKFGHSWLYD